MVFYSFHFRIKYASLTCHANEPGTVVPAMVTTKLCFPDQFLGNPSATAICIHDVWIFPLWLAYDWLFKKFIIQFTAHQVPSCFTAGWSSFPLRSLCLNLAPFASLSLAGGSEPIFHLFRIAFINDTYISHSCLSSERFFLALISPGHL